VPQAQDMPKLVGDAASLRIGEWGACNLRSLSDQSSRLVDAVGRFRTSHLVFRRYIRRRRPP